MPDRSGSVDPIWNVSCLDENLWDTAGRCPGAAKAPEHKLHPWNRFARRTPAHIICRTHQEEENYPAYYPAGFNFQTFHQKQQNKQKQQKQQKYPLNLQPFHQ
jgi:hypothetical protein